jgi:hypothetical protein
VQKNRKTPRFEVDYKERLEQKRTAINAVRLPRLGYSQYRVYDIRERSTRQYNNGNWQNWILWAVVDELESRTEPPHQVKWLKPKQVTLLRLQGHRVEEV